MHHTFASHWLQIRSNYICYLSGKICSIIILQYPVTYIEFKDLFFSLSKDFATQAHFDQNRDLERFQPMWNHLQKKLLKLSRDSHYLLANGAILKWLGHQVPNSRSGAFPWILLDFSWWDILDIDIGIKSYHLSSHSFENDLLVN